MKIAITVTALQTTMAVVATRLRSSLRSSLRCCCCAWRRCWARRMDSLSCPLCFVSAFVFDAAAQLGYYPGLAVLLFLALDFLVLAVFGTLCAAVLPLQVRAPDSLMRRAGRMLVVAPVRCVLAGVIMLAGIGGMILLFPVSVFWAVLFGFWLPGLAAMQTLFPVLRQEYGVPVRTIPRPAAPDKPLTAQEQKKKARANWWYYNWGIVAVAALVIVGVVYVAHGLLTSVDPDYTVAVVTADALPDEAVQRLQTALADYAEDANGDGAVVVQVNNYTWSANASLTDMNGQMAGATQLNTDLANGESKIWILEDHHKRANINRTFMDGNVNSNDNLATANNDAGDAVPSCLKTCNKSHI